MLDMGFIRDIRRILDLLPAAPPEPAVLGDVLRRDPAPRGRAPRTTRRPSRSRRATPPTELVTQVVYPVDRERKRELLSHLDPERPHRAGARLHPDQARREPPRRAARPRRHRRDRDPRQQEPGPAGPGARRLQGRPGVDPRRHRGRVARPRHRGPAARRELRAADGRRGLRPPDRPDRPGRGDRRRDLARLRRRGSRLLRDIEALLGHRIPTEVVPGFEPDRSIRPEPIRQPVAGSAGPTPGRSTGRRPPGPRVHAAAGRLATAAPHVAARPAAGAAAFSTRPAARARRTAPGRAGQRRRAPRSAPRPRARRDRQRPGRTSDRVIGTDRTGPPRDGR